MGTTVTGILNVVWFFKKTYKDSMYDTETNMKVKKSAYDFNMKKFVDPKSRIS